MLAADFAKELKNIIPSAKQFESQSAYFKHWKLSEKVTKVGFPEDPVFSLINKYDCTSLEIGLMRFYGDLKELDDNVAFADFIQDTIVVNLDTFEVQIVDIFNGGEVKFLCSPTTDDFLDSLLIYAKHFLMEQQGVTFSITELNSVLDEFNYINKNSIYHSFWRMTLGLDPLYG